jgi:2,4'-dihydroxyacetophenone dioxygenase
MQRQKKETVMPKIIEELETNYISGESLPWVPFTPYSDDVFLKYWKIDPVRGETVVSMRFPPGIDLPTHYHTGVVIARTVRGSWRYLEHDWISGPGDTVYETAASSHTPQSVGEEDAEVFFYIVGELEFVDASGNLLARENAKSGLARYAAYCEEHGLERQDLTSFTG